jgi:NDP-sugar pyrophosphorylase family protein
MTVESRPQSIRGIVLAGSYPKGRSLFDRVRPRPLLPIAQRPIISYPLRWLTRAGVEGLTVCTSGAAAALRRAVAAEVGSSLPLSFQQDGTPRGTAGSARDAALASSAQTFFVVNATAIPAVDPGALLEAHDTARAAVTVVVWNDAAATAGGMSPVGIYLFDRRAFEHVAADGFQDIKETLLPRLHQAGQTVVTYASQSVLPRVLSTETYLAANERMIPVQIGENPPEGFHRVGQALVHATAWISPRARLVGPVIVGAGVHVEDDATLVGPSALGEGCRVEAGAVVSRSVVWDHCLLGSGSLLDRCLVTDGAVVAPDTQLYSALKTGHERRPARGKPLPTARTSAQDRAAGAVAPATFRVRSA